MSRYSESATALNTAMKLMVEQDDTLLVAAISHSLDLVRSRSGTFVADGGRRTESSDRSSDAA